MFTRDVLRPRETVQYTYVHVRGHEAELLHFDPARNAPRPVILLDEPFAALAFNRLHIGAVDPRELALRVAQPCGAGCSIKHCAQAIAFSGQLRVSFFELHQFEAITSHITNAHERATCNGAAFGFKVTA